MRECRKRRVFEQKTITDFDRLELKAIVDDVIEYRINRGDL